MSDESSDKPGSEKPATPPVETHHAASSTETPKGDDTQDAAPVSAPPRVRRIVRSASTRAAEAAAAEAAAQAAATAEAQGATKESATPRSEATPTPPVSAGTPGAAKPFDTAPEPRRLERPAGATTGGPVSRPEGARDYRAPRPERPRTHTDRPRGPRRDGRPGRPPFGERRDGGDRGDARPRQPGMPPSSWLSASGQAPQRRSSPPREGGPSSQPRGQAPPAVRATGSEPHPAGAPPARAASVATAAAPKPQAPPKPAPVPLHIPLPRASSAPRSSKPALTAKEALSAKAKAMAGGAQPKDRTERKPEGTARAAELSPEMLAAGWDDAKNAAQRAGEAAPDLVEAWLAAGNVTAIAALADANDAPAAARKAARRAQSVLKARGTAIPERPRVARLAEEAQAVVEATLLPPDASGTIGISITSKDASGRYHIAEVICREPIGILHAGNAWLSGSQIKEGRNRALDSLGVAPVSIPVEWARHRIAAARLENAKSKHILPLGLDGCRELTEPAPAEPPPHPVADLETPITSESAWAKAPGSGSLHEEPEFRTWMPDRGAIEELLQKLGENLGQEGLKDPERVNKALGEEIASATDRFFSPEVRAVVANRMRDAAISVRARKGDERASDVLATGRAVREAGLITSPPREIPFLLAFFQKAIGVLAQQGGGSLRIPVPAAPPAEDEADEARP